MCLSVLLACVCMHQTHWGRKWASDALELGLLMFVSFYLSGPLSDILTFLYSCSLLPLEQIIHVIF